MKQLRRIQSTLFIAFLSALFLWVAPAYGVQIKNVAVSKVTPGSAVLVLKSDVTADVRVDYGISPGIYTLTKTSGAQVRHEVVLDGMTPGSTVYYRVTLTDSTNPASSISLPEKSFHLTRAVGEPFSYAVGGDNRPWTDITVQPAVWTTIVQQMAAENLDLSLSVGDIIYGAFYDALARNIAKYDGFFAVTSPLTSSVPLYPAVGNHESIATASNRVGYEQEFTLPVNNGADAVTYGEEYYSFVNGDTRFISLCTELPGQEGLITGNQLAWVQQELAANTSKWTIVFMHRPLFAGVHLTDPWMNTGNTAGQLNRWNLHNLFRQYGVDVVFEGHEHFYHHHVEDGIQYIITGGGGAPLMTTPSPLAGDVFSWSGYEHVKVDETASSLKVNAIDSTGVTRESFTLGTPALGLSQTRIYWATYADYLARDLSVDYKISNAGSGDATNLKAVYLTATNGVMPLSATPVSLGSLGAGSNKSATYHYSVPPGVLFFRAVTYVTCSDLAGGSYAYPGPAPA